MIRSKEDQQQANSSRMKKHIGTTNQRAQLQFHSAHSGEPEEKNESSVNAIEDLRRQGASLQSQLTTFMLQKKKKGGWQQGNYKKGSEQNVKFG